MYEMEWNGLGWEIYDTLWELFTYLVKGYFVPSWIDGWMDGFDEARNQ